MIMKEMVHQEYITILNLCVPSNLASKYIKQKFIELVGEIDISKIKVGNFTIPLLVIDRACRQNIN